MAKELEGQKAGAVDYRKIFDELIELHAQAAGKSISSILKADIEIYNPEIKEMTVKEVEYSILEPAIFVRSCLTSNVAGNVVMILRQRDMQAFLNELMGIDDLPDPDFEFDEVAMSAAAELMNQMIQSATKAMAEYLGDTMEAADCQLSLSDGRQNLPPVIGEAPDSKTTVIHYHIRIKDMVESEFLECISATAADSIAQEIEAKIEADARAAEEAKRLEEDQLNASAAGPGAAFGIGAGAGGQPVQGYPGSGYGGPGYGNAGNGAAGYGAAGNGAAGYGAGGNGAAGYGAAGNGAAGYGAAGYGTPGYGTAGSAGAGPSSGRGIGGSGYGRPVVSENLGLIMDVPLNVSVEIGKTRRRLKDVLNFNNGTVVELDKQADAPVDIIVNGQLIARGEVVVIDDNFGVRISEIVNTKSIIGNGE